MVRKLFSLHNITTGTSNSGIVITVDVLILLSGEVLIDNPPPKIVTANRGEDVTFSCKVNLKPHLNEDHLKIKWKHSGHYIPLHNKTDQYHEENRGQILKIHKVKREDGGVYNCIVSVGLKRDMASTRLIVRGKRAFIFDKSFHISDWL